MMPLPRSFNNCYEQTASCPWTGCSVSNMNHMCTGCREYVQQRSFANSFTASVRLIRAPACGAPVLPPITAYSTIAAVLLLPP
jgi:hypothetical protein